jgi:NitT/TauT family transport system substrate-binding protein
LEFYSRTIRSIESGVPIKLLAGLHSGCLELVAHDGVQKITDLKGKRIGVDNWNLSAHIFLALVTAYVGLAPNRDIQWVTSEEADMELGSMELFVNGKIDAFLAFPPQPQLLRARKIGHSILNTTLDQPWSQYYCCTAAVSADYIGGYPVATKRVLRAVLKAADLRYDRWRDFDIEDTIRFYALRMQEMGLSKAGPNKIIADGTDWRFINELKREMRS